MTDNTCSNCQTTDPVGVLTKTWRDTAAGRENVVLCELCNLTLAGSRFICGGREDKEILVIVQCLNIIRKDVAALLNKVNGK